MIVTGQANVLFIWDHKRISRKYTDFEKIRERLSERGARIYFTEERRWAANEGSGRFLDGVMALYAELDWEDITKKLKRGARRKIAVNKQILGGGDPPYGYMWEGYGKKRTHLMCDSLLSCRHQPIEVEWWTTKL